jgi:hypothetical protein
MLTGEAKSRRNAAVSIAAMAPQASFSPPQLLGLIKDQSGAYLDLQSMWFALCLEQRSSSEMFHL